MVEPITRLSCGLIIKLMLASVKQTVQDKDIRFNAHEF